MIRARFVPLLTSLMGLVGLSPAVLGQSPPSPQDVPAGLSAGDWDGIREAREADRHRVSTGLEGHVAVNPGQNWRTKFDGQGFSVQPNGADWSWGLQLAAFGFSGSETPVSGKAQASADGNRLAYDWTSNVQEWYINDSRGLEHGYTIQERPARDGHAGEALTFSLNVRGSLQAEIATSGRSVRFVDSDNGTALTYAGLHVFDANGLDLVASFEGGGSTFSIVVDEANATYPITIDPVAQQAYLKASNTEATDSFGAAVAISGDLVAIGANLEDSDASGVNGDPNNNGTRDSGAVYLFRKVAGSWVQEAYLKSSNAVTYDYFGQSVSVSGDRVLVGAWGESSDSTGVNGDETNAGATDSGAAYVFSRVGGVWSQEAYLKASNTGYGDKFGLKVSISNDLIAVSAPFESSASTGVNGNESDNSASEAGAVYLFRYSAGQWAQEAYIKASNTESGDGFGVGLSVSENVLVVGADNEDSASTGVNGNQGDNSATGAGAAYVFEGAAGVWSQVAYLKASNTDPADRFGFCVSNSGARIAVGAWAEDSNSQGINGDQSDNGASSAGAIYIFEEAAGNWDQTAYVKGADTLAQDRFGKSVEISGDNLIVGALREDSAAGGVNSGGYGTNATNSGAAYLFHNSGGTWIQKAQLKAILVGPADIFGYAVAISGDQIVVAAPGEDSSSTGVNGNANDNSAGQSGAAYIFQSDLPVANYCDSATVNSSGFPGSISMSGSRLVSANNFTLDATGLPQNQFAMFLNSQGSAYSHMPGGAQGSLCLGGAGYPIGRHNRSHEIRNTGTGGAMSLTLDLSDLPTALGIRAIVAGETWNFQAWYRDMNPTQTSNFTDAMSVQFE
ncbi:MAG: hypothetical protein GY930_13700 [bacterium]|nr:hypothetical protein [bacterium]